MVYSNGYVLSIEYHIVLSLYWIELTDQNHEKDSDDEEDDLAVFESLKGTIEEHSRQ